MISLRPHHLLCLKGFQGKGYSEIFVRNMTALAGRLEKDPDQAVRIQLEADDLCLFCPHCSAVDTCDSGDNCGRAGKCDHDDKVRQIDLRAAGAFGITSGTHRYSDLRRAADRNYTEQTIKEVCADCQWAGICRDAVIAGQVREQS